MSKNIALRNPDLSQRELNTAVQKTIDRIIFLRICEDRGIELYGRLLMLLNGPAVYPRLCELFRDADNKYNSGLFHFNAEKGRTDPPVEWTLGLQIDDAVLKSILRSLYYPESPYEFSVLAADILGQVYEQFLGKVIRLTKGHRAVVEDKPEVKKSGGVYYTPTYIVDYIVQNTVGKLVEAKPPHEIAGRTEKWNASKNLRPLSVLDPACGSGSFLIGAYQYLLDWYRDRFVDDGPKRHKQRLYQTRSNEWRLTTDERKRILLDHIYGVDIDSQAVEVTKLSLLLKVLEGETKETLQRQLFAKQRALPDLADNIKCGNSLIGPDFYKGQQLDLFDEDERLRINVFDWQREFAEIMKSDGFDAVIGNPPYGAELTANERNYVAQTYGTGTTDTAALFMAQARRLLIDGGVNGYIVPKPFTYASNWQHVRQALVGELTDLVDVGKVWQKVKLEQIIYRLERAAPCTSYTIGCRRQLEIARLGSIAKSDCETFGFLLNGIGPEELTIAKKMIEPGEYLGGFCSNVRGGMLQGAVAQNGKGLRVIGGKQIQRFSLVGSKGILPRDFPGIPSQARVGPKNILIQNIVAHITRPIDQIKIIGTIVPDQEAGELVILDTVNQLTPEDDVASEFILGVLHSRLMNWYVYRFIFAKAIRTMHFDGPVSNRIPVPFANSERRKLRKFHDRIAASVREIFRIVQRREEIKTDHERTAIERQIESTDREIDALVYELYGLSDKEIRLVEEATAR